MIFARTIANVLNGKKSQTRRLCYPSDSLGYVTIKGQKRLAVFDNTYKDRPRTRWIVGNTYAVQPERCHSARGRIRITGLRREENPLEISEADAIAEGFESAEAFRAAWKSLHKKNPVQAVWVIEFELVGAKARTGVMS